MNRTTGTSILVFGLVLGVIGAIMRYAVEANPAGFDVHVAGAILSIVGIVASVIGLLLLAFGGRSRSSVHENVTHTPSGSERIEERDTWVA